MAEPHWGADQIVTLLQRANGPVTKQDFQEGAGFPNNRDLREALDDVINRGVVKEVEEDAEGNAGQFYVLANGDQPVPGVPEPEDPGPDPEVNPESVQVSIKPATGKVTYRGTFVVQVQYDGDQDGPARVKAEAIQDELIKAMNEHMPTLQAAVLLEKVEAYDEPRVVFEAGQS